MQQFIKPDSKLTESDISNVENALWVIFPIDYRNFLLNNNGWRPVPAIFNIEWNIDNDCSQGRKSSELWRLFSIYDINSENYDDMNNENLLEMNTVDYKGRIPSDTIAIAQDPGWDVILLAVKWPHINKVLYWVRDYEVEEWEKPNYENIWFIADSFDDLINNKLH